MGKGVALVTGCSSGFGLLAAVTLARDGFTVAATMRDTGKRGRLDEDLARAGAKAHVLALDVTSADSIGACLKEVRASIGAIDVLVNNAGYGIGGFVYDLSLHEIRQQLETNFFGVVAMCKAVIPDMVARRAGRIINVSSIGGQVALPVMAAYSASKFAVEGFTESLRTELIPFGVWAVLIEPGTFRTDIFEGNKKVAAAGKDPSSPYVRASAHLEAFVDAMVKKSRQDPQWVADAILRAATAPRPRLRYLVGADAKVQSLAKRLVPWSLFERVIVWQARLLENVARPT